MSLEDELLLKKTDFSGGIYYYRGVNFHAHKRRQNGVQTQTITENVFQYLQGHICFWLVV